MAYIDFKKLKGRVPITDVLTHYGILEGLDEARHGLEGTCPFCGSNAFKVNVKKNVWFCFGECKADAKNNEESRGERNGGNTLDFVARKESVSVKKAAAYIAEWFPETTQGAQRKNAAPEMQPKEPAPTVPERTNAAEEEATDETEGQGSSTSNPGLTPNTGASLAAEDLTGLHNKPLEFTLKSITSEHEALESLGVGRATLEFFGVGYFTGKGMMHHKVVIPFHNTEGLLVAYAGYAPETHSYTYPKGFDPRLELYNSWRVSNTGLDDAGIVLVTDLLNVLRLHELGVKNVVALPTETLFPPQLARVRDLIADGGIIDFAPWTKEYVDTLAELLLHFHVRLHRYYQGSEDEFLSQLVSTLGW